MKWLDLPDELLLGRRLHGYFDDFQEYVTGDKFTTVASDAGGVTLLDQADGVIELDASDATVADNDETYIKGTKETFKFAADKPIFWEAYVDFDEANTDDANVIAGLMSAVAADALQDNGAGPAASYSGMVFFKVDGETVWTCESSVGATQTTTKLEAANKNNISGEDQTAGGAFQRLRIEFRPYSSTKAEVLFYIDGTLVAKHDLTYTSATEMQEVFGVKNGGANEEKLRVDYVAPYQLRTGG